MEVHVEVHTVLVRRDSYFGTVAVTVPNEELRAVFEYELGNHHDPWQYLIVFRINESTGRKRHFFSLDGPISAQAIGRRLCAMLMQLCSRGLAVTIGMIENLAENVVAVANHSFVRMVTGKSELHVRQLLNW